MALAIESGDLALARLNLQDLGRTYAAYTDKAVIDNEFTLNIQRFSKVIGSTASDKAPALPVSRQTAIPGLIDQPNPKQDVIEREGDNESMQARRMR